MKAKTNKGFSLIETVISCAIASAFFATSVLFLKSDMKMIDRLNTKYSHILNAEAVFEAAKKNSFSELITTESIIVSNIDSFTKCMELNKNGISLFTIRSKF